MNGNKACGRIAAAALALATILGVAGCGSANASTDNGANGDSGKVTTIKVVMSATDKPYAYQDENGKAAGFDVDVLNEIDEKLPQYKFEYSNGDYQTNLIGLKQNKYDLLIGSFFKTPAREEQYLLSKPYNYYFMNLIVNKDSPINSLEDLNGKTVDPIVPTDGRYVALQDWLKRHPDIKINVPTVTNQETYQDMANAVHAGTYDAIYLSKAQFDGVKDKLGYEMKVTDVVDGAGTVILYNKEKGGDLQKAVDEQIDPLIKDGTLSKLSEKWFGQDNYEIARKLGLIQ